MAELFDNEEPPLLNFAVMMTGGREQAAKDLVQQTFMAAALDWETVGQRPPAGQRAWLRTTCRNKWIDEIRRERRLRDLQGQLLRHHERTEADPADVVVSRDALARCWEVLRALPPVRHQVAWLYWIDGHTSSQIAVILGISPSGVRKHLSLAREIIHRQVGPYLNARLDDDSPDAHEGVGA
ncbi:sigma-70 family RNA polymerase sigma factor [Streptomyces cuspidosporus]|uniref:RNA polymerase sigma factor n=1 Tax=Streptomyces cuspidosporus TaxID=66882 RepID=UPI0031FDABF5